MEYRLSAALREHDDDVRGVVFPDQSFVLSASRDATVRIWRLLSSPPPKYDASISSHVQSFVNAVTFIPPVPEHPDGLVVSGGKDTVIDVRRPSAASEADAERLLLGHAQNVCALDVSVDGTYVISGSWDGTARIWSTKTWECDAVLEGHNGSVWTVLSFDHKTIITGCADRSIRLFDPRGKQYGDITGSQDVVRALCHIKDHSSSADFASAGNDAVIRLWKLDGSQVAQLHGHESFIYSLSSLPRGEIASAGEDRTVRIWKDHDCIQTITHPAISVWAVAVCAANGDIVSGASDKVVRIFTRDKERQALPEDVKAFEDSVRASSIPKHQAGDINKDKLPGPDFLELKSGTKEGQVQMIQEPDGSVSAHQWSQATQSWMNVGTVVDSAGSTGRKTSYGGQDYDYVFDVDIEDGKPPLKLPYNLSQNPYEAATKFIQDNELPMTYLDQVAGFITTNSQGATMGHSQASDASDPWGTGARYRPGEASAASENPSARPRVLPQTSYLAIKNANLRTVFNKVTQFNDEFRQEGSREIAINDVDLAAMNSGIGPLEAAISNPSATKDQNVSAVISPVLETLSLWPPSKRLPLLDLARVLAAVVPEFATIRVQGKDAVEHFIASGFEDSDRENNTMLAFRGLGNMFETSAGQDLMDTRFEQVLEKVRRSTSSTNRNLVIALGTLLVNYAVLYSNSSRKASRRSTDNALLLVDECIKLVNRSVDSEAVYRSLVAVGTLLAISEEVKMASNSILGLPEALDKMGRQNKETRLQALSLELGDLLNNEV